MGGNTVDNYFDDLFDSIVAGSVNNSNMQAARTILLIIVNELLMTIYEWQYTKKMCKSYSDSRLLLLVVMYVYKKCHNVSKKCHAMTS